MQLSSAISIRAVREVLDSEELAFRSDIGIASVVDFSDRDHVVQSLALL